MAVTSGEERAIRKMTDFLLDLFVLFAFLIVYIFKWRQNTRNLPSYPFLSRYFSGNKYIYVIVQLSPLYVKLFQWKIYTLNF